MAEHADALLLLDNVEDPSLVTTIFPVLVRKEAACSILYTSRNMAIPSGVTTHLVERLPEDAALHLLLETTRPHILAYWEAHYHDELEAARRVCQRVGYLPLGLVQLRSLLLQDKQVTLTRLYEVLTLRGVLPLGETLVETFRLSWEHVQDEGTRHLFKLASYFPEALPIPLWLVGIAAGLGEKGDIFEPLGRACIQLQILSLLEELSGDQVRLHPLIRDFGQQLVAEEGEKERILLEEAGKRLLRACTNLHWLERRARGEGYRQCLEQVRMVGQYLELLALPSDAEQVKQIEQWLDRESYCLADERWWPDTLPNLFYQQLYNRSVEEERPFPLEEKPGPWLRQLEPIGAENELFLRIFGGHTGWVEAVAFSPDGKQVLTGCWDNTARLWEASSGKELVRFEGHINHVYTVAFTVHNHLITTCDKSGWVYFWRQVISDQHNLVGIYVALYEVQAIHWEDTHSLVLSDNFGLGGHPHFYRLRIEMI